MLVKGAPGIFTQSTLIWCWTHFKKHKNIFAFFFFHFWTPIGHIFIASFLIYFLIKKMVGTGQQMAGVNTLRPRQNGRHFPDDIFKWIFFNENVWISIYISLKFVPRGPINNITTLVQVRAWRRSGAKPLSEPVMVRLLTHICVTWPQLVKRQATSTWNYDIPQSSGYNDNKVSIIPIGIH